MDRSDDEDDDQQDEEEDEQADDDDDEGHLDEDAEDDDPDLDMEELEDLLGEDDENDDIDEAGGSDEHGESHSDGDEELDGTKSGSSKYRRQNSDSDSHDEDGSDKDRDGSEQSFGKQNSDSSKNSNSSASSSSKKKRKSSDKGSRRSGTEITDVAAKLEDVPEAPKSDSSSNTSGFGSTDSEDEDDMVSDIETFNPDRKRMSWLAGGDADEQGELSLVRVSNDDLQEAALRGDVRLVRRLIDAKASVNAPMRPESDDEFMTLLHVLARKPFMKNSTEIIAEIVRYSANLNVRSSYGSTPLAFACHTKHLGAVEVLLKAKACPKPLDDHGRKATLYAILPLWPSDDNEDFITVKLVKLLAKSGADLNDGGDVSPIVEAVRNLHSAAVSALLACGAQPDGLHDAAFKAHPEMIQELAAAKANPFTLDMNETTVMDIALARGDEEVTTLIRNFIGDLQREQHPHCQTMLEIMKREDEKETLARKKVAQLVDTETKKRQSMALRQALVIPEDPWYKPYLEQLQNLARKLNRQKVFQGLMFASLLMALFVTDAFVLMNVANNKILDSILIIIMVAFFIDFIVQLTGYTKNYAFSSFFWMDLIGVFSVPLDASFVSNALPSSFNNPVVMRIARMAKLGARAGRFTKLVKLLRFLPGMGSQDDGGTAKVISATLNMALSTRVAGLIIVMVIVIPLFSLATFPESDYSMTMWTNFLEDVANYEPQNLTSTITYLEEFYSDLSYYPYEVNLRYDNGTSQKMTLSSTAPARALAKIEVQANGGSTVHFNFTKPQQIDSICNILLIITIIIAMVGSSLLLSNAVRSIVLLPLEVLLDKVRSVAADIFKSATAMEKQEEGDAQDVDEDEVAQSGDAFGMETQLLNKVLKKIAILSAIQAKKSPLDVEALEKIGNNDRGFLQGFMTDAAIGVVNTVSVPVIDTADEIIEALEELIEFHLTEVGLSWDEFNDWELDTLALDEVQKHALCLSIVMSHRGNVVQRGETSNDWQTCCSQFLELAAKGYNSSASYHFWGHAVDVAFTLGRVLNLSAADRYLSSLERYGLIVAAIGHDMGHPGVNNMFLIETQDELAICYNDKSPLESMHCAKLFDLLKDPATNIFAELFSATVQGDSSSDCGHHSLHRLLIS